jgi:hypothetical protein
LLFWAEQFMAKPIKALQRRRNREAASLDPSVTVRLPQSVLDQIEFWSRRQRETVSRAKAICSLIELGLAGAQSVRPANKKAAAKASKLAGQMIDILDDDSAPPDVRAKRKRRLLKGPPEFRDIRSDLPKSKG